MNKIKVSIDNKECITEKGKLLVEVAEENGIYIPTLCNYKGLNPKGSCRLCTVKVNGRLMTACTTPANDGMDIYNNTEELNNIRKTIIEALFVEGNHYCPVCEKSGNCELQAHAYKFQMMIPRFPYEFNTKDVDATHPKIFKDNNRCILCKRCVRGIKDEQGRSIFANQYRGQYLRINIDKELAEEMTDELAKKASEICPVGSILLRENAYREPVGQRKFDLEPIGNEIEKQTV